MKRGLLIVAAFVALSLQIQAKGGAESDSLKPIFRAPFKNNWFVGFGVGGSLYMGDNDFKTPGGILKNLTPVGQVQVGKWLTPSIGIRGQVGGGQYQGWDPAFVNSRNESGIPVYGLPVVQKFNYVDGHLDFLWSLTGDQVQRKWNYTLLAGVGCCYNFGDMKVPSFPIKRHMYMVYKVGAIASYNINEGLSAFAELQGTMLPDQCDGDCEFGKYYYDGATALSVGLTYRFKGSYRGFQLGLSNAEVAELNSAINDLHATKKELEMAKASLENDVTSLKQSLTVAQNKPAERVEVPVWVEGSKVILKGVVAFATDKSVCLPGEEVKIEEAAMELKKHSDVVIEIAGYANPKYGSRWYNMMLSNRRAKYVADQLKLKFDVPESQIEVIPYGVNKNPMTEFGENKVVVFYLKKKK